MSVKGSRIDSLVVVAQGENVRNTYGLLFAFSYLLSLLIVVAGAHYGWGWFQTGLAQEKNSLQSQVQELQANLKVMKDEVVVSRHGADITQQAEERVRQDVVALEEQLSEYRQEVAFYKAIMAPGDLKEGLRVERLELNETVDAGRVRYKIMLTQLSNHRRSVTGGLEVMIAGSQAGEVKTFPLAQLDPQLKLNRQNFRFRYFQNFSGELVLPEGFLAEKLIVVLKPKGQTYGKVEKEFEWQLHTAGVANADQQ